MKKIVKINTTNKMTVLKMDKEPTFPGGACVLVEKYTKGNEERSHPLFLNTSFHCSLRASETSECP